MRAKLLTLRFSPTLGRFDDAELVMLQRRVIFDSVREHLVTISGEPLLVMLVSWREQPASAAPPTPREEGAVEAPTTAEAANPARPVPDLRAELDTEQRTLFDQIRRWRSQKAHDEGAPPYVVLTNRKPQQETHPRSATTTWACAPRRRHPARSRGSPHDIRAQCTVMSRSAAGAGAC